MYKHFDLEFFKGNRQHLRQLFTGTAPIVLTANGLLQSHGDVTFKFHQDSHFWYLTGVPDPDVILVMDKNKEYLIIPDYETSKEKFDGAINRQVLQEISGIELIYGEEEGWKILAKRLKKAKHLATVTPPPTFVGGHYRFYTNPARAQLLEKIKTHNQHLELLDISPHLVKMRCIKQPAELAAINEAITVTAKAIRQIQRRSYNFEYEVEAAITGSFKRSGGVNHGWPPIVASGERACVVHHMDNNHAINTKELIVVDVGAEVDNYSADITRTYSQTTPTKRQRQVFEAVQAVQQYAINLLKPGTILKDYEQAVEEFMGEKLRALGLIKTIERDQVRQYFTHATSHFLGLDVHDVGDYQQPLEPGMVLTVEPGIYIPEEGIGVRLEDDLLITTEGNQLLSARLPQKLY